MKVIVINGYPRSGKDTFVSYCKDVLIRNGIPAYDFSTITPIKLIARQFGWNGQKDSASRKMLSDIRTALTEWNDYTFNYIKKTIHDTESADRPLKIDMLLKSTGISIVDKENRFKPFSQILEELNEKRDTKSEEVEEAEREVRMCVNKEGRYKNYKEAVYFIYCREPEEIKKYVDFFDAVTLLIDKKPTNIAELSNDSDKMVMNYYYNYIIDNNGTLDMLHESAETFLKEIKII